MASWPGTLPTSFLLDSLEFPRRQRQSLHLPTDVGPGITRRRSSAVSQYFTGVMHMTEAQYEALITFYDDTLIGGSQAFDWTHPLTGDDCSMRFDLQQDSDIAIIGVPKPDLWVVRLSFEILP